MNVFNGGYPMPDDTQAPPEIYPEHHDADGDGTNDCIIIYSLDYTIPLWGDYRGVEIARIRYNPTNRRSIDYAVTWARKIQYLAQKHQGES